MVSSGQSMTSSRRFAHCKALNHKHRWAPPSLLPLDLQQRRQLRFSKTLNLICFDWITHESRDKRDVWESRKSGANRSAMFFTGLMFDLVASSSTTVYEGFHMGSNSRVQRGSERANTGQHLKSGTNPILFTVRCQKCPKYFYDAQLVTALTYPQSDP